MSSWARTGLPTFGSRDASQQESEVTDAMEAVLEETLRLNIHLNTEVDKLKRRLRVVVPVGDAGDG